MTTPVIAPSILAGTSRRIESIDLLRGIVMIIMALDHIRDFFHSSSFLYSPNDLTRTSPAIFFTRWITHFCAPVFILLAGTSARLSRAKKTKKEMSAFLFTRGLFLLFVEVFIMSFALTFNPGYPFILLQVIWAIGICMICLSLLIHLPDRLILIIGLLLIFGHNALDGLSSTGQGLGSFLWAILHQQNIFRIGQRTILVGYPVIPWIGVIAVGYSLGRLYLPDYDQEKRKKRLSYIGWGAIIVFILLRWVNVYGDPSHWSYQKNSIFTLLSFLNATKYPPSLLYLLMTLGPALVFLSLAEKPPGFFSRKITVFGRVPLFYYIVHFYLIHLLAMVAAELTGYKWSDMVLSTFVTFTSTLKGFGFSLIIVYLIWIGIVLSLYPLCKWYDLYKRNHRGKWWLSYL